MSLLNRKKVLLAVTAGIAAYKTAFLVRLLVKKGAEVKVIMTPDALDFVTPLTLSTLSKNPVEWKYSSEEGIWNSQVELGLWPDFMVVAPATANTLSKMANGTSDNLVLSTYLSAKCPVYVAPAMDLDMYKHPTTKENLNKLISYSNKIIPAESGELASGLSGEGRMAEPENIISFIEKDLESTAPFLGKKFLISAGPTYEKIDPVRFIGNFSSGKMGIELARAASDLGADVTLVCGPSNENTDDIHLKRINVISAREMKEVIDEQFHDSNIVIMAAAVADYRPSKEEIQKIKKEGDDVLTLELVKNPDILKELGERKSHQILVGFALETNNEEEFAKAKLKNKNLDFIVLNSLQDEKAGFQKDTNKVKILSKEGKIIAYDAKNKSDVAKDILTFILENY